MNNEAKTLLKVENLQKYFPINKSSIFQRKVEYVKANKDISLDILKGETLGIVGESGCGKSTFGRTLIQLYEQTGGVTLYYGDTIEAMMPAYVKEVYKSVPTLMTSYFEDEANLNTLIERVDALHIDEDIESLRVARNAFELKYGNALRLVGGLLLHPNLNLVRDILVEKYTVGTKLSKTKRDLEFESFRLDIAGKETSKKKEDLTKTLAEIQKEMDAVNTKLVSTKDAVRGHEAYRRLEDKRDTGIDISKLDKEEMRHLRKDLQIIFQDPYSSLDPRFTVGNIIGEGLVAHGIFESAKADGYQEYIEDIMEKCGLDRSFIHRYPHQFSGGQRQRIGIARALALKPKFIVCDEAVSALDVSIQSQVINLLQDLKDEHNLTYLFITHDLGVVRYISDRIGVMYFGRMVELAPAEEIFSNPQHPYTKQLLAAIPRMEKDQAEIEKLLAKSTNTNFDFQGFLETGEADKEWYEVNPGHFVACRILSNQAEGVE